MASDKSGIKVTASDALEFEAVAPKVRKGGGVIKTLLFVVFAVVFGAAGWAFYGERVVALFNDTDQEIPIIRADISPMKVRPENPGGLQVPDRDKLVYNRIQNGSGTSQERAAVERLLPPPETLLPRPQAPEPKTSEAATAITPQANIAQTPKVSDVAAAVKPTPAPAPPPVPAVSSPATKSLNSLASQQPQSGPTRLAKNTAPTPTVQPTPPVTSPSSQNSAAVQTQSAASSGPVSPPSNNVYRVQLAAARSPEAARTEWDRLRRKNLDILGDLGLAITKVDLGSSKGIFYRLRVGPLKDEAEARSLCKALAARKIGCLVVRPGK